MVLMSQLLSLGIATFRGIKAWGVLYLQGKLRARVDVPHHPKIPGDQCLGCIVFPLMNEGMR